MKQIQRADSEQGGVKSKHLEEEGRVELEWRTCFLLSFSVPFMTIIHSNITMETERP